LIKIRKIYKKYNVYLDVYKKIDKLTLKAVSQ